MRRLKIWHTDNRDREELFKWSETKLLEYMLLENVRIHLRVAIVLVLFCNPIVTCQFQTCIFIFRAITHHGYEKVE